MFDPASEPCVTADELDQALKEHATGPVASEADVTNVVDHFILQQPLADGRTVAEVFAAEHPELTNDDRQVLLQTAAANMLTSHHCDTLSAPSPAGNASRASQAPRWISSRGVILLALIALLGR